MHDLGHEVYLYAGEEVEAPVTELVTCINEEMRAYAVSLVPHYTQFPFHGDLWDKFNANAIAGIASRIEKEDFICLIGGSAQKPITDAFPSHMSVEFGVGYGGVFAKYRVFESYAWMHSIYAGWKNPTTADGQFYDAVIPGYLEPEMFPLGDGKGDEQGEYYLFIGRLIDRKGYRIAQEVCQRLGKRLILAGPGEQSGYGEFVGSVDPEQRAKLMGGAIATFAPTLYVEPFGNVVIESQACGTPTITTDWGAFVENNPHGVTGFRCRTLQEFMDATESVKLLDRAEIRRHAISKYNLEIIGLAYEDYFERLLTLWGDGWYSVA